MSFLGSAKHTLSIGVRVMSDEAVAGFRKAASAAEESINRQRAVVRELDAAVRSANAAQKAAAFDISVARRKTSAEIKQESIALAEVTGKIKEQEAALRRLEAARPKGDAALSQTYVDTRNKNKLLNDEIAALRTANSELQKKNKLEEESSRIGLRAKTKDTREKLEADTKELEKLRKDIGLSRVSDLADRGKTPAAFKQALAKYESKSEELAKAKEARALVSQQQAASKRAVEAGSLGVRLLSTGALSPEKAAAAYGNIAEQLQAKKITEAQAASERDLLRQSGVFASVEDAKKYAAHAGFDALSSKKELDKLDALISEKSKELRSTAKALKSETKVPEDVRRRAEERIGMLKRSVELRSSIAGGRSAIRDEAEAARIAVDKANADRNRQYLTNIKDIRRKEKQIVALPEKGESPAAKKYREDMKAAQDALGPLKVSKAQIESNIAGIRAKADPEIKRLREVEALASKALEHERKRANEAKSARDAAISEAAKQREQVRGLRQQLVGAITESIAKIAMTLQFIKTVMAATRSAENFEFSARSVSALLGERRGSGEALYNQYFAKYGQLQSEVMPTAAVERMKQLAAAGYTKSGMVENTAAIFDVMLASAGELTEQSAADLGISLERAFGSLRMDMRTALDTAVKAANQFPMTVGNIRDALGYATEAAVQSGQSLEETLLVIGSIMPIAKTASKAGTITRNALLSLVKPESQQILSELGVRPVDAEGKRRPMMDVFLDLNDQLNEVAKGKASKYYNSPEFIAAEKARAKAEGRKYEPRTLDKVFKNQLGLEREQLEFKLTGVRGGAIFAAINRMVETTAEKLQGTAFEGMRAADARTAFEFLRLGLSGAAGESARLAGELRRTSKMLGESFDASLERFKINLGTAALPMKDAFLAVGKQVLDYFSGVLTPAPGSGKEYIPGASTGLNAFGTFAGVAVTGFLAKQVLSFGKALYDAKALIGLQTQSLLPAAAAGAETAGVLGGVSAAFASLRAFLLSPAGLIAGLGVAAGALFSLKIGADAAYKAVTDFSDYLDRQNKSRMQKEEKALGAMFEALASGNLKYDEKTGAVSGLNRGQMLDIAAAGPLAGTLVRDLAAGTLNPSKAGEMLLQGREAQIRAQYALRPDDLKVKLQELEADRPRILEEVMQNLMRTLLTSENYKGTGKQQGSYTHKQLLNEYALQLARKAQFLPLANEFPTGGAETALRVNFMKEQDANTMEEAMSKAGFFDRLDFEYKLRKIAAVERSKITDAEDLNRTRVKALGLEDYFRNEAPTKEELLNLPFVKNNPERMAKLAEFEQRQASAPTPISSRSQLNAQGVYEAAITQTSFFTPAVEAFIKTVGEGQQSLVRVPEFAEKIADFLSKAATQQGQAELATILSQLKLARENAGPPTMTLPNGESGN